MTEPVLIYGGGMLGRQVAHLLQQHHSARYRLVGFVDDVQDAGTAVFDDVEVLGGLDTVAGDPRFAPGEVAMIFAIGYTDMRARHDAFRRADGLGYVFPPLLHPAASVETSARLGRGVVVLAGAVVDQYASLGDICYLHNGSVVGENCVLGANNYLSAGTILGGSINTGSDVFFGINCTIVNDIDIGSDVFINAGSLVYKSVADNMRVVEFREQREVRHR